MMMPPLIALTSLSELRPYPRLHLPVRIPVPPPYLCTPRLTRPRPRLTLIIISRFILNLRRFSQHTGDPLESESWTSGPEDARGAHHSLPRSYLSSILFRSGARGADQSDRTAAQSLHDGIMVKVSTYSDADDLRGVESDFDADDVEGVGEAIALERVHFDAAHRRHSQLPPYRYQAFDPLESPRVQKGVAC